MRHVRPTSKAMGLILLLVAATVARGDDGSTGDGHLRLSAMAGAGSVNHNTYFVVGGKVGYEVAFGFTLGVDGHWWMGATPSMFKLSPGLTWYAPLPLVRPYVGAFYSHWFVGAGYGDRDALGGRAGLQVASMGPASVDAGVAYERQLSCSVDCDTWWPEVTAGIRF